jgi:hypothetical protein
VTNNPCFNASTNKSTWTYKFFTDCAMSTRAISGFVVPICSTITNRQVLVEEKIDGCGAFASVSFSLKVTDPNFGTPPVGFQFLKVDNNSRFDKGVAVIYRITLNGNFPTAAQPIKVKAATQILTFDCNPGVCYLVPSCPSAGDLVLTKTCTKNFSGNTVTLQFIDTVANNGNATVNNVAYSDQIGYDANHITVGQITVNPSTLTVNTSVPGVITVSGNLGNLAPGGTTSVTINVPIADVSAPGTYNITSNASVSGTGTQSSATCTLSLEVIQLSTSKCCNISDSHTASFTITVASVGASPQTVIDIRDSLVIPAGITVQFISFGGCTATFTDGTPVPLNTDLTNRLIHITCSPLTIPAGNIVSKIVEFRVVSINAFGIIPILNTFDKINFISPTPQLNLGAGPLPASATINMVAALQCANPCR